MRDIYEIIAKGFENDFIMSAWHIDGCVQVKCRLENACCGPDGGEDLVEVSGLQDWDVTMTVSQFEKQFIRFVE